MSIAVAAIPSPFVHSSQKRRQNVWHSIASGNWTDPNIWRSNALSLSGNINNTYPGQGSSTYIFPRIGDTVYINHTVTLDTTAIVNNLYISGTFKADNGTRSISVYGDIQATGAVDFTSSNVNLILYGVNNYIVNFTSGTTSTVTYARAGNQLIMDLSYRNLGVSGIGTKYQTSNLTLTGTLSVVSGGTMDSYLYDLTVNSTSSVNGTLLKTGSGSMLFIGTLSASSGVINLTGGNPTVELRGGFNFFSGNVNFGTNTVSATTNTQSWGALATPVTIQTLVITGAITVTNSASSGGYIQINGSLDGTVAGSTFKNAGLLNMNTTTAPMVTGVIDIATLANTVAYIMNGAFTVPYTTYSSLTTSGTGTKTLIGTTTLAGALAVSAGTLELSTYDLNVGTTTGIVGTLSKTGAGNLLFTGLFTNNGTITFSGNPNVEFKGGFSTVFGSFTFGSGTFTFSTNNQTFNAQFVTPTVPATIVISGAITLTISSSTTVIVTGTINGNNAASTLDNRGTVQYQHATRPMITGVLQTNAAVNTFNYNKAGAQDVTGGTYRNLTLAGSGVKTLQGNVSVINTYTLTAPATKDNNGFTFGNP